jgi:tetratricopeptide (TPR) repeat protein
LELGKLNEAEINLKQAYSLEPQDTFVINLLAILNLKNRKIDDAFELLSTSAKIDPNNAETQNYLGMVLGERGLRTDAENAFRAALKSNPRYSVAHYNLAVLYATTKPAYPQLANYHYQKAVSLGASTNPDFEKLLQTALEESQAPEEGVATE